MDSSQKIYDINMEEEYIEPLTDELTPNEASTSKEVSPTLQNETSAEQVDVSEEVADQSVRDSLPEEAVLSQTSNSKPNSTAKTNNKNKRKSKAKATKKKKAWEADDSDGHEDPDPQLDPVKIDYEALCTDPKYDNEGDVWVWDAHQFTYQSIRRFGLRNPIVFTGQQDVLGVEIPDIDYNGITDNIDPATKIDVFDHKSEKTKNMLVTQVVEEMQKPVEERMGPLNMLSLEVSYQRLGQMVQPPRLVREIDWGNYLFPVDKFKQRHYSRVEKYAIMTMAKCYTEFHIDFAGTSVWYHLKKGTKYFFLIEPTPIALHLYEEFICAYRSGVSVGFFGDVVDGKCTRVKMTAGQTLILPAGWIHAVYTPEDSLVFGGNYLHSFSIPMQVTVRDQETRGQTKKKFTYQCYDQILWYYVAEVVQKTLAKDYVRLFKRDEYDEIQQRLAICPEEFKNCCYDILLPKPEFYDDPHTGDPIQFNFDPIDRTIIPPPTKFNEDYLNDLTLFEKKGLYKLKELLGDFRNLNLNRRFCKVAEGIRRPRHLLQDFQHILDHISYMELQKDTVLVKNSQTNKMGIEKVESQENGGKFETKDEDMPVLKNEVYSDINNSLNSQENRISNFNESQDSRLNYSQGSEAKSQADSNVNDENVSKQSRLDDKQSVDNNASQENTDVTQNSTESQTKTENGENQLSQEPEKIKKPKRTKKATKNEDDEEWTPGQEVEKAERSKSKSDEEDEDINLDGETVPKKRKKEKHVKRVSGMIARVNSKEKITSPTEHKKPESFTQPAKRRRSYLKSNKEHHNNTSTEHPHGSKHPPKHHLDAPPPEAEAPVDLVPLGRKFNHQHVSNLKRVNAHLVPVAVHGAKLTIHVDEKKPKKHKISHSPHSSSSEQQKLFNDMFMSQPTEKRKVSLPKHSPTSSQASTSSKAYSPKPAISPISTSSPGLSSPTKYRHGDIPYTPTRPNLNLSGIHTPFSASNPYNQSFNFTPGGYDPRTVMSPPAKPDSQLLQSSLYSPTARPAPAAPNSFKPPPVAFKYQNAMDELDDINNILGMDN